MPVYLHLRVWTSALALLCATAAAKTPFTVADSIERQRLLSFGFGDHTEAIRISPDQSRYLCVISKGDLKANGNWVELVTGKTDSLETAASFEIAARLFSKSTGNTPATILNQVSWLKNNEEAMMLWDHGENQHAVMRFNLRTKQQSVALAHPTDIVSFASEDGSSIFYYAFSPRPAEKYEAMLREGFAVSTRNAYRILGGDYDGWEPWLTLQLWVSTTSDPKPRQVTVNGGWPGAGPDSRINSSPNPRFALIGLPALGVPDEWDNYTDPILKTMLIPAARKSALHLRDLRIFHLVDARDATARPLWNSPRGIFEKVAWSPNGSRILIGPTYLPPTKAIPAGLAGTAVADVDPTTGDYVTVPIPADSLAQDFKELSWIDAETVLVEIGRSRLSYRKTQGQWQALSSPPVPQSPNPSAVRIELHQDLNTSPGLFAVGKEAGQKRLILEMNPGLREKNLGRVELTHWKDADGRTWTARLYYPTDYEKGRRYPLAIQTHGYSTTEFSLQGDERFPTAFAAQALANRQIAVLQMDKPDRGQPPATLTTEGRAYQAGFEGAVDHLVAEGLVDRAKVGLSGFSRTGWHVEYTLTHSTRDFAAAIVADNVDHSYVQGVMDDKVRFAFDQTNGGAPFGEGLRKWFQESPGFNADKIRTPLRMENDNRVAGMMQHWELFVQLSELKKPVELAMIPEVDRGCHLLQNPKQLLASQGGAVDWYDYWLNDHEDPDPAKLEQYTRWRKLRALQQADRDTRARAPAVTGTQ